MKYDYDTGIIYFEEKEFTEYGNLARRYYGIQSKRARIKKKYLKKLMSEAIALYLKGFKEGLYE